MLATICAGGMVMSDTSRSGLIPTEASQYRVHIAWVPGGYVMANVIGVPLALASSASGLSCGGVFTPLSSSAFVSVMACPFRFRYIGMIIGFTGEPLSPMV